MGFYYFGFGHVHPCKIADNNVTFYLPSGKEVSFPTGLSDEISLQNNTFYSETVAFYLRENGKEYIGRYDGSISIYRESDNLLIGLNNWKAPMFANTQLCGYFNNGIDIGEIHLDLNDRRTAYVTGCYAQGCFETPMNFDPNIDVSELFAARRFMQLDTYIVEGGGNLVTTDFWVIQKDLRDRNCRVFL